jgi:hypothetical protein
MILLTGTNHSLELETSTSSSTDWTCSYVDITTTDIAPGSNQGNVASATTTTIAAAPAASTQRQVKQVSVTNKNTASQTIKVKKDVGGTEYVVFVALLESSHTAQYVDGRGWNVFDAQGRIRTANPEKEAVSGTRPIHYYKTGTASEGTAYWYSFAKDGGMPGAWSPGTPGVAGRATDGMTAADTGCVPLWTPTGTIYLDRALTTVQATCFPMLMDILWVNTGLVVTTTTSQTVNSVAFPARDINGTVNGAGCMIGMLFTAASTNGAAISNSTITYTNSGGTGSRTATLIATAGDQIPPSAVIGTVVWFRLAAGDDGVQSIQSITLNTSLGAGSISLIVARPICGFTNNVTNNGYEYVFPSPGVKIYTGANLHMFHKSVSSSAVTLHGQFNFTER